MSKNEDEKSFAGASEGPTLRTNEGSRPIRPEDVGEMPEQWKARVEENPFTSAGLSGLPPVAPRMPPYRVVHVTSADLIGKYRHSPICLAESMADYLNEQYKADKICVGTLGDTTNHYFIFVDR